MEKLFTAVVVAFIGAVFIAVIGVVVAYPLMLLWNWLVPAIFGLKTITFLEALGLYLLCGIVFKSPISIEGNSND
jgi:hypothetical protein